jgi:hypothetical protein
LSDLVEKTKVLLEILPEEKLPPNFGEDKLHDIGQMFQVPVTPSTPRPEPALEGVHPPTKKSCKYRELDILKEIEGHILSTYGAHYVGKDSIQTLDLIFASGHGNGFCIGGAMKYLSRYGKKEGFNRKDLLKAAHFVILSIYLNSNEKDDEK